MATDVAALCERASELCHALAPIDLADMPVYVLPQSRLPADLGGAAICDGFTQDTLDLYLRDVIGAGWRGRGPCMVIRDAAFAGCAEPRAIELTFLAIAIHELAHVLERDQPFRDRSDLTSEAIQQQALANGRQVASEPSQAQRDQPWIYHNARFSRVAIHLRHRAGLLGVPVSAALLCAGPAYGLSPASEYVKALGDEPARLLGDSFRTIRQSQVPDPFFRLWTADVAAWLDQHPVPKEAA
ncbi:hypothetical protein [Caldimonas sp.]|uniref:hypothetical protein n=1 Tax=Caldimonas sp. TaxID=2838790 RepID=UPI003919FB49